MSLKVHFRGTAIIPKLGVMAPTTRTLEVPQVKDIMASLKRSPVRIQLGIVGQDGKETLLNIDNYIAILKRIEETEKNALLAGTVQKNDTGKIKTPAVAITPKLNIVPETPAVPVVETDQTPEEKTEEVSVVEETPVVETVQNPDPIKTNNQYKQNNNFNSKNKYKK
jgi:hypothetical protein